MMQSTPEPSAWWRLPAWILAGILAVGVLSVTAALAQPEFKRLVLFYVVYGLACGFVLRWLARELLPMGGGRLTVLAMLLGLLGAVNLGYLSYRHFEQGRQELAEKKSRDIAVLESLKSESDEDLELQNAYDKELRRYRPVFQDYLRHRVAALGQWESPWPELFWGIEVLAAAVATGFGFGRPRRHRDPPTTV